LSLNARRKKTNGKRGTAASEKEEAVTKKPRKTGTYETNEKLWVHGPENMVGKKNLRPK